MWPPGMRLSLTTPSTAVPATASVALKDFQLELCVIVSVVSLSTFVLVLAFFLFCRISKYGEGEDIDTTDQSAQMERVQVFQEVGLI